MADSTICTIEGKPWPTFDPGAGPTGSGNVGSGHLWPVLGGERGEYDVAAGEPSRRDTFLTAMRNMTSGQGLEPEQVWEDPDLGALAVRHRSDHRLDRLRQRPVRPGRPAR